MSFHPARLGLIPHPKSAAPRLPCVIFFGAEGLQ